VIWVVELTVKLVAATDPNCTELTEAKLVPLITTEVPPVDGPEIGLTPPTVGGPVTSAYVNRSAAVTGLVPAGVVTRTSTAPAAPAGAVTVMDVALNAVTLPAAAPKVTTGVPGVKLEPPMVTTAPPASGPVFGLTDATAGGGVTNVNWSAPLVADVPAGVVTVMSTVPGPPLGETAVIWSAVLTAKLAAFAVPNLTLVAPVKLAPAMTTEVPPAAVPVTGLTPVTDGGGMYVNWSAATTALVPAGVVTVMSTWPDPAGDMAVICAEEFTAKEVAATLPNETPVAPVNVLPVMTTDVPPPAGPLFGLTPVTAGGGVTKVNTSADPAGLVPPRLVTVTWTGPGAPAGDVAVICPALLTAKLAAATPPNATPVAPLKLEPVMTTDVPPAVVPPAGLIPVTAGGLGGVTNVNLSAATSALVPAGVVTVTSTCPGPAAGEVAVIDVVLSTVKVTGVPPNDTPVAPLKFVPEMATAVPPAVLPPAGLSPLTTGAGVT
jgi:hypothetical protein